jgi:hypothetical protein
MKPKSLHLKSNLARQMRALKEGRGLGRGVNYTAFIQIRRHDFASQGRSHYWLSAIMDRHHDLLSDLECNALLYCQLLNPYDIREQYPLSLSGVEHEFEKDYPDAQGTLDVANSIGIKHPRISADEPRIMTTDLLVSTRSDQDLAIYVKYTKDLSNTRKKELYAIEKTYWQQRGVRPVVFTEQDVQYKVIGNLLMFASFDSTSISSIDDEWLRQVSTLADTYPMDTVLRKVKNKEGVSHRILVDRVKWACATGRLSFDLSKKRLVWDEVWPKRRFQVSTTSTRIFK